MGDFSPTHAGAIAVEMGDKARPGGSFRARIVLTEHDAV
jgi:hypothetical protein